MAQSCFANLGAEKLHYLQYGTGADVLIAFHGYGLNGNSFSALVDLLQNHYTLLFVDLPHHGDSKWGSGKFTVDMLMQFIGQIKVKYDVDKVNLLGYSLGGRACLKILERDPAVVKHLVLLAPDGLIFNFPYYLATKNVLGKLIFRHIVHKPGIFFFVAGWMHRRKILDTSRYKFVTHYMESKEARAFLYAVWTSMADIVPCLPKVKSLIKSEKIHLTIIMGRYDKIIPVWYAERFRRGLDTLELIVLEKGHRLLDHHTAQNIAEILLRL